MALSVAERQARYRAKKKKAGLSRKDSWIKKQQQEGEADTAKQNKKELRQTEKDMYCQRGKVFGIVTAALLMVKHGRKDIAKEILKTFGIDRLTCAKAALPQKEREEISPYLM